MKLEFRVATLVRNFTPHLSRRTGLDAKKHVIKITLKYLLIDYWKLHCRKIQERKHLNNAHHWNRCKYCWRVWQKYSRCIWGLHCQHGHLFKSVTRHQIDPENRLNMGFFHFHFYFFLETSLTYESARVCEVLHGNWGEQQTETKDKPEVNSAHLRRRLAF